MTRDEMRQHITEIMGCATPEKQARVSELLTELSEGFETLLSEGEQHQNQITELTNNNETLRTVNAKLFLKVGATERETHVNEPTPVEPPVENKITFDQLFNEKGELL